MVIFMGLKKSMYMTKKILILSLKKSLQDWMSQYVLLKTVKFKVSDQINLFVACEKWANLTTFFGRSCLEIVLISYKLWLVTKYLSNMQITLTTWEKLWLNIVFLLAVKFKKYIYTLNPMTNLFESILKTF